jgi:hypothetical protein
MKFLAALAVAAVGLSMGCADVPATNDAPVRARAPANDAAPTKPGVEAAVSTIKSAPTVIS